MPQNRFKQLREEHGLSQIELGNRLGVTQQSVFAWEHGKAAPQIQTAIQLSQLYGVSLDYLMGLSDTPKMEEPAVTDDELRNNIAKRISALPAPILSKVLDLADTILSYKANGQASPADPCPSDRHDP